MKANMFLIVPAACVCLAACASGPQQNSLQPNAATPPTSESASFYDPFAVRAAGDSLDALSRGAGQLLD